MDQRLNYTKVAPDGVEGISKLESYIRKSGLEPDLIELAKLRASQINGCAYCIDMHTKDARTNGESERAALAWVEAVTLISKDQMSDDIYNNAREYFSEKEHVDLTLAVIAINSWNRLAISFRTPAGSYQPDHPAVKKNSLAKQQRTK